MPLDVSQSSTNLLLPGLGRLQGRAERFQRKKAEHAADVQRDQALVGAAVGAVAGGVIGGVPGAPFSLLSAAQGASVGSRIGGGDIAGGFGELAQIATAERRQEAGLAQIQLREDLRAKAKDAGLEWAFSPKQQHRISELNANKDDLSTAFMTRQLLEDEYDAGIADIENELDAIEKQLLPKKRPSLQEMWDNGLIKNDDGIVSWLDKNGVPVIKDFREKDAGESAAEKAAAKATERALSDATKAFAADPRNATKDSFGELLPVDTQTPKAQVAIVADAQRRQAYAQVREQAAAEGRVPTEQDFINADPEQLEKQQQNLRLDALQTIGDLVQRLGPDPRQWPEDAILSAVESAKRILTSQGTELRPDQIEFFRTILVLAKRLGAQ